MTKNKILAHYLDWADQHGVRRLYEVLPSWLQDNYPKFYSKHESTLDLSLLGVLHKNDHAYRALSSGAKLEMKRLRHEAYVNFWRLFYPEVRKCIYCDCLLKRYTKEYQVTHSIPPGLRDKDEHYCSARCLRADPVAKERMIQTNLAKYGTEWPSSTQEFRDKVVKTNRKRYGVDNPSHSPEVIAKILSGRYGRKTIKLKNKTFLYQGYEHVVLRWMVENRKVDPKYITTDQKKIKSFSYYDHTTKRQRTYFPDIKVKSNKGNIWFFEVKSTLTIGFRDKATYKTVRSKMAAMQQVHGKRYMIALAGEFKLIKLISSLEELDATVKELRNRKRSKSLR